LWLTRFTELRTSGLSSNWSSTAVHNLILHSFATALSAGGADKWAGMVEVREAYPKLTDQPLDESHLQRLVLKVNGDQAGRDAFFRRTSGRTNKQLRTDTSPPRWTSLRPWDRFPAPAAPRCSIWPIYWTMTASMRLPRSADFHPKTGFPYRSTMTHRGGTTGQFCASSKASSDYRGRLPHLPSRQIRRALLRST
jgi:hypothetical protein